MLRKFFGGRGGGERNTGGQEALPSGESKLARVRAELQSNRSVIVAGEYINDIPHGYWHETVDICVAPAKPIFNAGKLNQFMSGLIKRVPHTSVDQIQENSTYGRGGLTVGVLYYDERIDPNFSQKGNRRTRVRVFPKANVAELVSVFQNEMLRGNLDAEGTTWELDYLENTIYGPQMEVIKKHSSLMGSAKLLK